MNTRRETQRQEDWKPWSVERLREFKGPVYRKHIGDSWKQFVSSNREKNIRGSWKDLRRFKGTVSSTHQLVYFSTYLFVLSWTNYNVRDKTRIPRQSKLEHHVRKTCIVHNIKCINDEILRENARRTGGVVWNFL